MMCFKKTDGFSAPELLMVVAIIGIIAAVAIPSFISGIPRRQLKSAARDLYGAVQQARLLAVKKKVSVRLCFDYSSGIDSYYLDTDGDEVCNFNSDFKRIDLAEEYGDDVKFGNGTAAGKKPYVAVNSNFPVTGVTNPSFLFSPQGIVSYYMNSTNNVNIVEIEGGNAVDTVYLQNVNNPLESFAVTVNMTGNAKISWYGGNGTWE